MTNWGKTGLRMLGKAGKFILKKPVKELASTAVLTGALAYGISGCDGALKHARQALKYADHMGTTGTEMVVGSKGQRGVRNLEEALDAVKLASEGNEEARKVLEGYVTNRKSFAHDLSDVYKSNETLSRESQRLYTQLQGFIVNTFEIGNDVKGKTWKGIDDKIMKLYGKEPVKAREESAQVRKFYDEVQKFYDARDKNENTVKEFCDYLGKVKRVSEEQNKSIENMFPKVVSAVKEGYSVEDEIFSAGEKGILGMKKRVSPEDIRNVGNRTGNFERTADNTERGVIKAVPEIKAYSPFRWYDYATNPWILGLAGAIGIKGIATVTGTNGLVNGVTLLPVYAAGKGVGYLGRRVRKSTGKKELNIDEPEYQI